jgi:hypothetical protein
MSPVASRNGVERSRQQQLESEMEMDSKDWVIWTAALRDSEHSARMRHAHVALTQPVETGRWQRRGEARSVGEAVCVHVHSVAGSTCLVDFVRGGDHFTILMDTAAARALQFTEVQS